MKKSFVIILTILLLGIFAFSVSAEETAPLESGALLTGQATSTPTAALPTTESVGTPTESVGAETTPTSTPEIVPEVIPTPPPPVESAPPAVSEVEPEPTPSLPPATEPPPPLPVEPAPQPGPSPVEGPTPPPPPEPPAPTAEPAPQPAPSPVEGPTPTPLPVPVIDLATAPSKVTIRVLMPDGSSPPFPVFVTFVGVGNKNFGGKINANGELTVIMPSGRYYTELLVISTEYAQGEDGPSFFLEANEERDFGAIRLIPKSQQTSQKLEDKTLEEDILAQAESAKGTGKILVLIVKLLIKILEEIRAIAQKLG